MDKLKELLGNSYHDGMTVEEVNTALSSLQLVDLSTGNYVDKANYVEKSKYDKDTNELQTQISSLIEKANANDKTGKKEKEDPEIKKLKTMLEAQRLEINKSKANGNMAKAKSLLGIKDEDNEFVDFIDTLSKNDNEQSNTLSMYINKLINNAYEKGKQDVAKDGLGEMGNAKQQGIIKDQEPLGATIAKNSMPTNSSDYYFGKYNK